MKKLKFTSLAIQTAPSEYSEQTARMHADLNHRWTHIWEGMFSYSYNLIVSNAYDFNAVCHKITNVSNKLQLSPAATFN